MGNGYQNRLFFLFSFLDNIYNSFTTPVERNFNEGTAKNFDVVSRYLRFVPGVGGKHGCLSQKGV